MRTYLLLAALTVLVEGTGRVKHNTGNKSQK